MTTGSGFKFKFFLVVMLMAVLSLTAFADPLPFVEQQILTASDGGYQDSFGNGLVMDGDTALIANNSEVYVFTRSGSTWTEQGKLIPGEPLAGAILDLKGDTAVIGSPNADNRLGAAYVFKRSGSVWTQQAKITTSDSIVGDDFGSTVLIDGDNILVSAPSGDGSREGAVYVFAFNGTTWVQQARFSASDSEPLDGFGGSLALEGNTLLVGAPFAPNPEYYVGAVYVFNRSGNTWVEQTKLNPDAGLGRGQFGSRIALQGNTVLISAPQEGGLLGAVYVFEGSGTTWTKVAKLLPNDIVNPPGSVYFGTDIAFEGDNALIGTPFNPNDNMRGSVYEFSRSGTTWTQQAKLLPASRADYDAFGSYVEMEGDTALISSPNYYGQGKVHVFVRGGTPLNTELLVNGGFEIDSNGDFVPDGWTRKNPKGDGRRCNQPAQPAYEGSCSYLFKDDASGNNKLIQNVDLNVHDLNAGDKVKLTGFYNKQSAGSIEIRLFVTYASLPEDEAHITLTQTTSGYKAINPLAITLDAKPTRVRVQIQNQTTSGKTWFDGLSLKLTDNSSLAPLIPLPLP